MNPRFNRALLTVLILISILSSSVIAGKLHQLSTLQDQKMAYFDALTAEETKLKLSLQNINKQINYLNSTLDQVRGLPSMKIVALEEALADERDSLYSLQQDYKLPLNFRVVNCKNVTKAERDSIGLSIERIEAELESLKANIDDMKIKAPNCALCKELQTEYDWSKGYLNKLKQIQSFTCPTLLPQVNGTQGVGIANTAGYSNISNLDANSWVFGDTTLDDYYLQQFQYLTSTNITKCPIKTPFVEKGSDDCIVCPNDSPYYSLETLRCVACPKDKPFANHYCGGKTSAAILTGTSALIGGALLGAGGSKGCSNGMYYNETLKVCLCPVNSPYLSASGSCISCILPRYFNSQSRQCEQCPKETAYNPANSKCEVCPDSSPWLVNGICIPCPIGTFFNSDSDRCTNCPGGKVFDDKSKGCQCPSQNPYFDGKKCFNCNPPTYFDQESNNCQQCEDNLFFNSKSGKCEQCPADTPLSNGLVCTTCPGSRFWDISSKSCKECPINSYFDLDSQLCHKCPDGTNYNSTSNQCMMTVYSCTLGRIFNFTTMKCQCPESNPEFDGFRCLNCPKFTIWNSTATKCEQCQQNEYFYKGKCIACDQGQYFNEDKQKCEKSKCQNNQIYNSTTDKCSCPPNFPFFSGQKCVSCNAPHFWDTTNKSCENCPEGSYLDSDRIECLRCPKKFPNYDGKRCFACPQNTTYNKTTDKCEGLEITCPSNFQYNAQDNSCSCPEDAPYNDGKSCISCESPNFWNKKELKCKTCDIYHYYEEQSGVCVQCPDDKPIYNPESRECQEKRPSCPSTYVLNDDKSKCVCPSIAPFDDGQSCQKCYLPNFWNLDENKCQSCPDGQHYDINKLRCVYCPQETPLFDGKKCVACPEGQTYLESKRICSPSSTKCKDTYIYDPSTQKCVCPENLPYDDRSKCVSCELPRYWDENKRQCLECPEGTAYDFERRQCIKQKSNGTVIGGGLLALGGGAAAIAGAGSQNCDDPYVFNRVLNKCTCPENKFDNGKDCVACYLPKYWNLDDKKCESCPKYEYYDTNLKKCTFCPPETPFLDINQLHQAKCVACPDGTHYVKKTHTCWRYEDMCQNGYLFDPVSQKCICPKDAPFDDGTKCLTCYLPQYWNHDSKKCESCPQFQYYNTDQSKCAFCPSEKPYLAGYKCIACPDGSKFNSDTRECANYSSLCPETYSYSKEDDKCVCPKTAPFNDGSKCVACYLPKYWNHGNKSCESCPQFQYYNTESKRCEFCPEQKPYLDEFKCVACPNNTVYVNESHNCVSFNKMCKETFQYNSESQKCVCPKDLPFNSGQKCVACYLPKYWNHDSKSCEACPEFQYYNTDEKECKFCPKQLPLLDKFKCIACPPGTLFLAKSRACVSYSEYCPATYSYDNNTGKCVCPKESPFNTGDKCISCFLPKYWNADTKTCDSCPNFQLYNPDSQQCDFCPEETPLLNGAKCEACPKQTIFDIKNRICVSYEEYCGSTFTYDSESKKCVCPKDTPFNNGKICVSCYLPNYWNHDTKECETCPDYQVYDIKQKACAPCPSETPVIEKYRCVACPSNTIFQKESHSCVSFDKFCPSTFTYNKQTEKCECGEQTPFNDGQKCVSCFLPQYWNHDTKACQYCEENKYYNINSKRCEFCPGDKPNLVNYVCKECPKNTFFIRDKRKCLSSSDLCSSTYQYNPKSQKCECPSVTPFDDGSKCVSCYLPKYWNHDNKQCENCKDGYEYDTNIKRCVKKNP